MFIGVALGLLACLAQPVQSAREPWIYHLKGGVLSGMPLNPDEHTIGVAATIESDWDPAAEIATDGDDLFIMSGGNLYRRSANGLALGRRQLLDAGGWRGKIAVHGKHIYRAHDGALYLSVIEGTRVTTPRRIAAAGWSGEIAVDGRQIYLLRDQTLYAAPLSPETGALKSRLQHFSDGRWDGAFAVGNESLYHTSWTGKIAISPSLPDLDSDLPILNIPFPIPIVRELFPGSKAADRSNLLINGSFEQPDASHSRAGWFTYGPSPSGDDLHQGAEILGWRIPTGNIDVISSYWKARKGRGTQSIDLAGSASGAIEQTFSTVPGQRYLLSGYISHHPKVGPPVKAQVDLDGKQARVIFHNERTTHRAMQWRRFQHRFYATGKSTTLRITNTSGSPNHGVALDGLSVTAQ